MQGNTAIGRILKQEGVEYLFCFPYNLLIEECAIAGIRPIMTRTERTLINMADGYSRVSNGRKLGVAAVQHGPGSENAFAGVAQAYSDSVPLLFLPGGADQRRLGVSPTFDGARAYQPVSKWAERINFVERIPDFLRRAFSLLRNGRPGPVVLEVPDDVGKAELDDAAFRYTPPGRARSLADPDDVRAVARALLAAKRPLIHAGQGVFYAEATDELRRLAELLQAPVMTTLAAKSAFPEDHPLALGSAGYSTTGPVAHFLKESDLVFGIGCSFTKTNFGAPIPGGKTLVQATLDDRDLNKDYALDHALIGDAKLVLGQLCDEVERQAGTDGRRGEHGIARAIQEVRERWLADWLPRLTSDETPISPYRVVWELNQALDKANTILTHDSGNPRDQIVPFYQATTPHGYIGWGKSTQLGYSLGLTMGAKLAAPEKLAVNVMGDAAFGMAGMDVETAAREGIPILTIILNNSALGGYDHYLPVASERHRINRLTGDYTKVAAGLGAYGERVERASEIVPAIERARRALASGQPAVLEVITREDPTLSKFW